MPLHVGGEPRVEDLPQLADFWVAGLPGRLGAEGTPRSRIREWRVRVSGGLGFFAPQIAVVGIVWLLGVLGYAGSCVIAYPLRNHPVG